MTNQRYKHMLTADGHLRPMNTQLTPAQEFGFKPLAKQQTQHIYATTDAHIYATAPRR